MNPDLYKNIHFNKNYCIFPTVHNIGGKAWGKHYFNKLIFKNIIRYKKSNFK